MTRRILAFSVLACLATVPAFCLATSPALAWGEGASGPSPGIGTNGSTGDHGEADARGNLGNGPTGPEQGQRWDDELGCVEGTLTRCNK